MDNPPPVTKQEIISAIRVLHVMPELITWWWDKHSMWDRERLTGISQVTLSKYKKFKNKGQVTVISILSAITEDM